MADIWLKIFIATFCPVVVACIVAYARGYVQLRDKSRDHDKCLKNDNDDIKELQAQIKDLEKRREQDLIESRSLEGVNTIVETKIKLEIAAIMKEISNQRHEDIMMYKEALTQLKEGFTGALSEVRETMSGVNATVIQMGKEFERLRKSKENI